MKTCTKCGTAKPEYHFNNDKGQKSGLRPSCKQCSAQYQKTRDRKKVNAIGRAATKRWRAKNKNKVSDYNKSYIRKPEVKKIRRERRATWCKINRDESRRLSRISYHKLSIAIRAKRKDSIDNLDDKYVLEVLSKQVGIYLKICDVSTEIIELKRNALKIKRLINAKSTKSARSAGLQKSQ